MRSSAGLDFLHLPHLRRHTPWVALVSGCVAAICWRPAYPAIIQESSMQSVTQCTVGAGAVLIRCRRTSLHSVGDDHPTPERHATEPNPNRIRTVGEKCPIQWRRDRGEVGRPDLGVRRESHLRSGLERLLGAKDMRLFGWLRPVSGGQGPAQRTLDEVWPVRTLVGGWGHRVRPAPEPVRRQGLPAG